MEKVITFGEIMLRLSPPGNKRFTQADELEVTYGGGEANVACSLANYHIDSCFVTKVPDNPIGQSAVNHLRRFGIDTSCIKKGGERLGIYFLETGTAQLPSHVVYDRVHSAFSEAEPKEFPWEKILPGGTWFHFTGITPALSDNAAEITLAALKAAKELGLTVSCDLNYRKKLWSPEKARQVMTELAKYVDVCIGNEEDAEKIFGLKVPDSDIDAGKLNHAGYAALAKQLKQEYGFKIVAISLRDSYSASNNGWSGMLFDGVQCYQSKTFNIFPINDRVGSGDSFAGGLIYALLKEKSLQDTINFAVAASCLKHSIPGDFNQVSKEEVELLVRGNESGRVQR